MSSRKKNEVPFWAKIGHSRPRTRREFLATSAGSFLGYMALPSIGSLISQSAFAANCAPPPRSMSAFITVNLTGGGALGGNYVPMDQGGQPLASYSKMGLGDGALPIERAFNNVPFAGRIGTRLISQFLDGILSVAAQATIDNTAFVGICGASRDDSGDNAGDLSGLMQKAGLAGSLLPGIGKPNFVPAYQVVGTTPLEVSRASDISRAVSYQGGLAALTPAQRNLIAAKASQLSGSQSRALASTSQKAAIDLIECTGVASKSLVSGSGLDIDPLSNARVATTWNINTGTVNTRDHFFAAAAYCALNGNAGASALVMGGYDYHDNTRTSGDARDRDAGQVVGRLLETAAAMNQKLFIWVTTDGAVSSADSNTDRQSPWTSDRGTAGVSYILAYSPTGRPSVSSSQIGFFTQGQVADTAGVVGADHQKTAAAVFANFLSFNKRLSVFDSSMPSAVFSSAQLDQIVKIAG